MIEKTIVNSDIINLNKKVGERYLKIKNKQCVPSGKI